MILWRGKQTLEDRGEHMPCSAFRWTFQVTRGSIGWVHQYQHKSDGQWNNSHTSVYEVAITSHWLWGSRHMYYDGPHCSFSLGPVHFCWGNWKCKTCCPKR